MDIDKNDGVSFRAFSNLASVALCSMGLLSFWLSNYRTSGNIIVFLSILFVSLLIRFCAIFIITKNVGRVRIATVLPIVWFVMLCYLVQSDALEGQYLNFWLGLLLS